MEIDPTQHDDQPLGPFDFSITDAAKYCKVGPNTIRRWIAHGKLPAVQIGGRKGPIRIRRADVDALMKPVA